MALLIRIYFNAVFGGLGGLLGWMLFGAFGDRNLSEPVLGGALIGGSIGYFVVSVEGIRDRSLIRFVRLASYGVILGAVGGALGMWLGDSVNYNLVVRIGGGRDGDAGHLMRTMLARGLGWLVLGLAVGLSEGIAGRSARQVFYGSVGGALGGFIGGALFGVFYIKALAEGSTTYIWGAIGLIILGASIGALSAFVQGVLQSASLRVLRGWQEGREFPLLKRRTFIGRDEHADIALFRDMLIEKRHALIQREGSRYFLVNNDSPREQTRVNDGSVAHECELQDGDRLQLGNVVLRFQMRAAKR